MKVASLMREPMFLGLPEGRGAAAPAGPGVVMTMEPKPPATPKPSKVEAIKLASEYLKVHLAEEAFNGVSHFTEDAATVLKFHGSYQQDDRDHRTLLKREGKEKAYSMMVRVRMPGGKCTAEQYLAVDHLART